MDDMDVGEDPAVASTDAMDVEESSRNPPRPDLEPLKEMAGEYHIVLLSIPRHIL